MKLLFACLLLLTLLCNVLARPQYKEVDYKFYETDQVPADDGVAVDSVYEFVSDKPPDEKKHHHHHKKMKTNRLERLKRYLAGWDRL